MPKELAIGSIPYSYPLFKDFNSDESFHVPNHCQHDLLYRQLSRELFLYQRVSMFPFQILSLQNQVCNSKPLLSPFINIFFNKTCFSVYIILSSVNFIWFAFLSHEKFQDRPLFKLGALHLIRCDFE